VTIGAHGRNHLSLRWADDPADEMQRSRDDLAAWLDESPTAFSYPFGVPGRDVSDRTIAIARECGFACAVVNHERPVVAPLDTLAIPRAVSRDIDGAIIASQLAEISSS
jgi:peptidoglycan/xylan/chitin deacetylase (PgdA/CDA1 family)